MKLLSIDISGDVPGVPAPQVGHQWVLVRLHDRPVGMLKLDRRPYLASELRQLAIDSHAAEIVRERSRRRFRLEQGAERALPAVTVAVCTRDGADRLGDCLDSLTAIDYPAARLDIVVVENVPRDERTRRLVGEYPGVRYIEEPRPGLDWARNRAILEARGDIIAFTDDDASVDGGWARALATVFQEEPGAMAVTGLVVADEIDVEAQRLFEEYGGFGRGFRRQYFRVDAKRGERAAARFGGTGRFGTGANMAFRRSFFESAGMFDPALDVGTVTNGGGDLEMFFRVIKRGHLLVYAPEAIVRHRHRRDYGALRTQLANNGIGFYAYIVRSMGAHPDERTSFVRLAIWWYLTWNIRRFVLSLFRRSPFPLDLVVAELRGSVAGLRRYSRARIDAADIERRFGPQRRHSAQDASS